MVSGAVALDELSTLCVVFSLLALAHLLMAKFSSLPRFVVGRDCKYCTGSWRARASCCNWRIRAAMIDVGMDAISFAIAASMTALWPVSGRAFGTAIIRFSRVTFIVSGAAMVVRATVGDAPVAMLNPANRFPLEYGPSYLGSVAAALSSW